jgi:SAM-dependent methyltransferase
VTEPPVLHRSIDPRYLAYQYGDAEKLRIRIETHGRYSEQPADDFHAEYVAMLAPAPGSTVLDVGCGPGAYHPKLGAAGARVVAFDFSPGMVQEACQQARRDNLPVRAFRADAQAIPLPDSSCDHAIASHMLYHVPDIRRALEEMRRVVKVGGRVLITTNAADHSARLYELHAQAARELDYTAIPSGPTTRFNLDHLPLVRSVFPNAVLDRRPNAFVFPDADAALRYYASARVDSIEPRPDDASHREPLLNRMRELIDEIISREGVFRVPKNAGSFLATVEA